MITEGLLEVILIGETEPRRVNEECTASIIEDVVVSGEFKS
jgi:hypothetical protein